MDDTDRTLIAQAARARDRAIRRLLDSRRQSVAWESPIDLNALNGAVFIIMLRSTGLIERDVLQQDEVRIVRHLITQVNADGGFYRYRGAPSSRSTTRLAVLALRMCLGESGSRHRQAWKPTRNTLIDAGLAGRVRAAVEHGERFLAAGSSIGSHRTSDSGLPFLEGFIRVYAEGFSLAPVLRLALPRLLVAVIGPRPLGSWPEQINVMVRNMAPACAILASRIPGGGTARARRALSRRARPNDSDIRQGLSRARWQRFERSRTRTAPGSITRCSPCWTSWRCVRPACRSKIARLREP